MNKKTIESIKYLLRCPTVVQPYLNMVDGFFNMSNEERRIYNEARFLHIFQKAYSKSSFYHDLYAQEGIGIHDIKSLEDIYKLPVVTKDMIRSNPNSLLTTPKWQTIPSHTSGTTGTPLVVYESWPALWLEQAYVISYRERCGFRTGSDVIASLRGHLDRNDMLVYVGVSKTLYLSTFQLNNSHVGEYYSALCKYKPKAIEGYPSALLDLCLLLRENNLGLNIPIIFTSSETLGKEQREIIEATFNGQIFDHYGTTERTISLNENIDHKGYYEDPCYSINEYRSDSIITTSLINSAFPLIRYVVEDKVHFDDNNLITEISGRSVSFVTGKDGTHFSGAALNYLAKIIPNILIMQLVQKEIGKLDINILPNNSFCAENLNAIKAGMEDRIGTNNMDFCINIIKKSDLIYAPSSHKLELIVNLVAQQK